MGANVGESARRVVQLTAWFDFAEDIEHWMNDHEGCIPSALVETETARLIPAQMQNRLNNADDVIMDATLNCDLEECTWTRV